MNWLPWHGGVTNSSFGFAFQQNGLAPYVASMGCSPHPRRFRINGSSLVTLVLILSWDTTTPRLREQFVTYGVMTPEALSLARAGENLKAVIAATAGFRHRLALAALPFGDQAGLAQGVKLICWSSREKRTGLEADRAAPFARPWSNHVFISGETSNYLSPKHNPTILQIWLRRTANSCYVFGGIRAAGPRL
jgi:hypothetical protein